MSATRRRPKALPDRCATFHLNQLASLAQCLCQHELGPQRARWLPVSQDRAGLNGIRATQEALGRLLGARHVSVTAAATTLQHCGAIAYHRGDLQMRGRRALERAACGCNCNDLLERYTALFRDSRSCCDIGT